MPVHIPPSEAAIYAEKLAQKELDYNELQSMFTKYKLKQKVKHDKLRDEVNNYVKKSGGDKDKENAALLMIKVSETESRLEEAEKRAEALTRELQRRQTQLNDQVIVIRNMEEQLRSRMPMSDAERSERKRMTEMVDMESIHAQMMYKDERIVELNNVILDKERQILDLQEMVREHGEVASSKKQAMKLVQKRFEEIDSISRRSIGTETDSSLLNGSVSTTRGRQETVPSRPVRGSSPGRAVVKGPGGHSSGWSSPPPLDPSEVLSNRLFDEDDLPGTSHGYKGRRSIEQEKSKKKRVTFDLPSSGSVESVVQATVSETDARVEGSVPVRQVEEETDEISRAIEELTNENEQLRTMMAEQQRQLAEMQTQMNTSGTEIDRLVRDNKSAVAKARVVAQARIKDLEDKMADLNQNYSTQVERMQTEIETLRSTREWEIEENARLREQSAKLKEKNNKLHAELDASVAANRSMEERMIAEHEVMQRMMEDLEDAEGILVQQQDETTEVLEDVERLKGAIYAQEQFIEVLEADIVIYEEHIGILRDSLGASKVDHRDLIRSKAFEAKLKALEEEKQEIARTRHDERLRTKALNAKVRMLEGENEKLTAKICEMEMGKGEEEEKEERDTLELQLNEANHHIVSLRSEFEFQLNQAKQDAERAMQQSDLLRSSVHRLQDELDQRSSRDEGSSKEERGEGKQTVLEEERVETEEMVDLRRSLQETQTALARSEEANEDLNEQITSMGAENFEVRQLLEQLQRENESVRQAVAELEGMIAVPHEDMSRVSRERDVYQRMSAQLDSDLEGVKLRLIEKDEELRSTQDEMTQLRMTVEELRGQLTRQNMEQLESVKENQEESRPSEVPVLETVTALASANTEDSEWVNRLEEVEEENRRLRAELDHARLSIVETREVQKEVELLKKELDNERRQGELKWAEVCQRLSTVQPDQAEEPASRVTRKASIEEMHSYLDAYAEKCKRLEDELKEAKGKLESTSNSPIPPETVSLESALIDANERMDDVRREMTVREEENTRNEERIRQLEEELKKAAEKIEQDKQEKKKLKTAVKQLRDKAQQQKVVEENKQTEEEVTKVQSISLQSQPVYDNTLVEEMAELKEKLKNAEIEASLSGELNVELGRAMQELEERVDDLERVKEEREEELKRYEKMREQMEREMEVLKMNEEEFSFRAEQAEESFNADDLHVKISEMQQEIESLRSQLAFSNTELEEMKEKYGEVCLAAETQRRQLETREEDHSNEVRELSIKNEDLRRSLNDTEAKLANKEEECEQLRERVLSSGGYVPHHSVPIESTVEIVEEEPVQSQHESLLRASAATTNAVTAMMDQSHSGHAHAHHGGYEHGYYSAPTLPNIQQSIPLGSSSSEHCYGAPPTVSSSTYSAFTPVTPSSPQHSYASHGHGQHQQPSQSTTQSTQSASGTSVQSTVDHGYQHEHGYGYQHQQYYPYHHVEEQQQHHVHHDYTTHQSTSEVAVSVIQSVPLQTEYPLVQSQRGDVHEVAQEIVIDENVPPAVEQTTVGSEGDLFMENQLLREAVNETTRMHDDLGEDVEKLMELRMELENAVEALRGEIWTLNGQLKASVLDRENLADRVADLDSQFMSAKKRADQLDQELSEQVELTEKAQRQAAESENESNRRLAESLEMENRREEVEKAYAQLMEYYTQLHSSYEALYKSVHAEKADGQTETDVEGADIERGQEALRLHFVYQEQLALTREQVGTLREEMRDLATNVLSSELASLESSLTSSVSRIQSILHRMTTVDSAPGTSTSPNESTVVREQLDQIIQEFSLTEDISTSGDLQSRVSIVHQLLLKKLSEVEESRKAITEQRRVCSALEDRLTQLEQLGEGEAQTVRQLAGTQRALLQRTEECEELQRRVQELREAIDELTASHESNEAAKLATRQADVDGLFRANAELAHTNVRLQNELDEMMEERTQTTMETSEMQRNAVVEEKEEDGESAERKRWLEAEVARLRETERHLNEKIEEHDEQMKETGERVEELERELREAREKLSNAEADAEWGWEAEKESREAEMTEKQREMEREVERLRDKMRELEETKGDEDEMEAKEQEIIRLREVETLLNKTIGGFEEKLQEAEERIVLLEMTLSEETADKPIVPSTTAPEVEAPEEAWGWGEEESEVKEEKAEKKSEEGETQRWREQLEEERQRGEEAEQELSVLRSMCASLNDTISQLRMELADSQEKIVELEEREQTVQTTEGEKEDAWGWGNEETVHDEKASTSNQDEKEEERVREIERLQTVESQMKEALKQRLDEIEKLEWEYQEQQDEKERNESDLKAMIEELERRLAEKEREQTTVESAEKEGWGEEWGAGEETERKTEEIEEMKARLERSDARVDELTMELSSRNSEVSEMREKIADMQRQLGEVETQRDAALLQVHSTPTNANDGDGWGESWEEGDETEKQKEREMREEAEKQREQLEKRVHELTTTVSDLSSRLDDHDILEEEAETLREEVMNLKEELNRARVETEELREKMEKAETQTAPQQSEESGWGWGETEGEEKKEDDGEMDEMRSKTADLQEQLELIIGKVTELESQLEQSADDQAAIIRDSEELQNSLQAEVDELLARAAESEKAERYEREGKEEMQRKLEEAQIAAQQELSRLEEELRGVMVQLDTVSANDESSFEIATLTETIRQLEEKLEKAVKQNDLLKESECRLLDSVDEYGNQMEQYREEADRLQTVVNGLEREMMEVEGLRESVQKLERQRDEMVAEKEKKEKQENDGWGNDSSEELAQLQEEIEQLKEQLREKESSLSHVSAEKSELQKQLTVLQKRLSDVEKERDTVKRAYDELRSKIAARRRATAATASSTLSVAGGAGSRRSSVASSVATVDHEIPEEPIDRGMSMSPMSTVHGYGTTSSNQDSLPFVYHSLIDSILLSVETYLERADEQSEVENRELDLLCSRLFSIEQQFHSTQSGSSGDSTPTEETEDMARKKKVKTSPTVSTASTPISKDGTQSQGEEPVTPTEEIVSKVIVQQIEHVYHVSASSVEDLNGNEKTSNGSLSLEEVNGMKMELERVNRELEKLREIVAEQEGREMEKTSREEELKSLKSAFDKLQEERDVVKGELEQIEKEMGEKMREAEEAKTTQSMELSSLKSEMEVVNERLEKRECEMVEMQRKMGEMYTEGERDKEQKDLQLTEMNTQLESCLADLEETRTALEKKEKERKEMDERVQTMREEWEEMERKRETMEAEMERLKEGQMDREQMDRKVQTLEKELESVEEEKQRLMDREKDMLETTERLQTEMEEMKRAEKDMEVRLQVAEDERNASEDLVKGLQEEVERLTTVEEERVQMEERVQTLEETQKQLEYERFNHNVEMEMLRGRDNERVQMEERIKMLEEELEMVQTGLQLETQVETLEKERDEQRKRAEGEMEEQRKKAEGEMEEQRKKAEEEMEEQRKKAEGEMEEQRKKAEGEMEEQRKRAEGEMEEQRKKANEELEKQTGVLRVQLESMGAELDSVRLEGNAQMEKITSLCEDLEREKRRREAGERALDEESQRVQTLTSSLDSLQTQYGRSQRELDELTLSLEEAKRQLDMEMRERVEQHELLVNSEMESRQLSVQLEELKRELQVEKEQNVKSEDTVVEEPSPPPEEDLESVKMERDETREKMRRMETELTIERGQKERLMGEIMGMQGGMEAFQREQMENNEIIRSLQYELHKSDSTLRETRESAQRMMEELEMKRVEAEERCREMESQWLSEREMSDRAIVEGREMEKELRRQLEESERRERETKQELSDCSLRLREVTSSVRDTVLPVSSSSPEEVSHLRDDCIQLETQLRHTHDTLSTLKEQLTETQRRLENREKATMEARNENGRLRGELEEREFEMDQMRRAAMNHDSTARVLEVERELSEQRTRHAERMDALIDELRVAEQQLAESQQNEKETVRTVDTLKEEVNQWRTQYEAALQETETLQRAVGEVRHLEAALEQSRTDQFHLVGQLNQAVEAGRQAVADKDALGVQLTIVSQQLEERTERLRQAGEAKTHQTMRLVELESQLNASRLQRRESIPRGESVDSQRRQSVDDQPAVMSVVSLNEQEPCSSTAMNDPPTLSYDEMRTQLEGAQRRIRQLESSSSNNPISLLFGDTVDEETGQSISHDSMTDDYVNTSSSRLLLASSPLPSLSHRLHRLVRSWRIRSGRPRGALMPYVRYGIVVYFVLSQLALIHCWFIAACV